MWVLRPTTYRKYIFSSSIQDQVARVNHMLTTKVGDVKGESGRPRTI